MHQKVKSLTLFRFFIIRTKCSSWRKSEAKKKSYKLILITNKLGFLVSTIFRFWAH